MVVHQREAIHESFFRRGCGCDGARSGRRGIDGSGVLGGRSRPGACDMRRQRSARTRGARISTDPSNAGLHGQQGTIAAVPYTGSEFAVSARVASSGWGSSTLSTFRWHAVLLAGRHLVDGIGEAAALAGRFPTPGGGPSAQGIHGGSNCGGIVSRHAGARSTRRKRGWLSLRRKLHARSIPLISIGRICASGIWWRAISRRASLDAGAITFRFSASKK